MEKWTENKYKLLLNNLRQELKNQDKTSEYDVMHAATEYLSKDMKKYGSELRRYMEYSMGVVDAARKLAEDIGYVKDSNAVVYEGFSDDELEFQQDEGTDTFCLQCLFCKFLGIYRGCLQHGIIPEDIFNKEAKCDEFVLNEMLKKSYDKFFE